MNIVDEMPEEGQFVAAWVHNDNVWSSEYKWHNGTLLIFNDDASDFILEEFMDSVEFLSRLNEVKYITK